jgi:hypothetical protein
VFLVHARLIVWRQREASKSAEKFNALNMSAVVSVKFALPRMRSRPLRLNGLRIERGTANHSRLWSAGGWQSKIRCGAPPR